MRDQNQAEFAQLVGYKWSPWHHLCVDTNKHAALRDAKYFPNVCDTNSTYLLHNFLLKSFI